MLFLYLIVIVVVFMIYSDARQLRINQTKPFFGCIDLTFDNNKGITLFTDHFIKYYVNSTIQKRLSLDCLNTVRNLNTADIALVSLFLLAICTFSKL